MHLLQMLDHLPLELESVFVHMCDYDEKNQKYKIGYKDNDNDNNTNDGNNDDSGNDYNNGKRGTITILHNIASSSYKNSPYQEQD